MVKQNSKHGTFKHKHNRLIFVKNNIHLSAKFNFIQKYITDTLSDKTAWAKFVAKTKFLDKQRKLSIKTVFPRFYNLVKTHGFED